MTLGRIRAYARSAATAAIGSELTFLMIAATTLAPPDVQDFGASVLFVREDGPAAAVALDLQRVIGPALNVRF